MALQTLWKTSNRFKNIIIIFFVKEVLNIYKYKSYLLHKNIIKKYLSLYFLSTIFKKELIFILKKILSWKS